MTDNEIWLASPAVAKRYSKCTKTIERWEKDQSLNFPRPMIINGRKFRRLRELEAWEIRRAALCTSPKTAAVNSPGDA
jgi:hypothetical protein